jgi:hypothetical protein
MFARLFQSSLIVVPVVLGLAGVMPLTLCAVCAAIAAAAFAADLLLKDRFGSSAAEVVTVGESLSLAVLAASLHEVAALSGLLVVPILLRRDRHPDAIARLAGIAAVFVLFASWAVTKGIIPTWYELGAALAVGAVGLAAGSATPTRNVVMFSTPMTATLLAEQPVAFPDEQKILELREAYRRLKSLYDENLRRSDSDRASMCLVDWRFGDGHSIKELAHALRNAAEVDGAAIYTVPDIREGMVLAGASGSAPAESRTLQVPVQAATILIRERASEALRDLKTGKGMACENVILLDRGRLVGLAALYDDNKDRITRGKQTLEAISPLLARLLRDEHEAEGLRTRAIRAELLADLGTRYLDSTRLEAAQGICDDLVASLKLDGCTISARGPEGFSHLGQSGPSVDPILEALVMGQSLGLSGWAEAGARELVVPEARDDVRYDRLVAVRKAVGMLVILPLFSSGSLIGALTAWTEEAHGINAVMLGTLRAVVPHVLRRCLGGHPTTRPGLVDRDTFWNGSQGPGSFVEIDLGRNEGAEPGDPVPAELQQARRKLLATTISKLPQGGLLTRRPTGTLVAFLAGFDEKTTEAWAAALTPATDGPWGMSLKVLGFSQQSTQFFQKVSA